MKKNNDPFVICGYARTPLGVMQGIYCDVPAPKLASFAIAKALENAQALDPHLVSEVFLGCVLAAGVGQAPARQAAIASGIPNTVPTTTINKVCGSGMKSVQLAIQSIAAEQASVVVAGGMENMTRAPYLLARARQGYRLGHDSLYDHMFFDGLQDAYSGELMGVYAEATAEKYGFSREQQDEYALSSLQRATAARDQGVFTTEIAKVSVEQRSQTVCHEDDEPLAKAKPDKIPKLRPAFADNGTVTAANSSSIADGAAALIISKRSIAEQLGLAIVAEILGVTQHAQTPEWFTTAPVGAIEKLYKLAGLKKSDVDLFEINEAFAVVTMAAITELQLEDSKVNIHGGACALGHPIGASGARIIVSLLNALQHHKKEIGVAGICIGGGEALALALRYVG